VAVTSVALVETLPVEAVDVVVHRAGHFGGALAETFDQLAAIGLHGAVELGEVAVMRLPSVGYRG